MTAAAFLFGGQGTELPRMGLDVAEHVPAARALIGQAGEIAGVDPVRVLTSGGPDFQSTRVLQPLLTAVSLGVAAALAAEGIVPAIVAGHSLGELAAWAAAGAITPADAVTLAGVRGAAMEREAARRRGAMLALSAAPASRVIAAVREGRRHGVVAIAAHNAPGEWTLSGDEPALRVIAAAHRSTWLPVSGAWHSPAMRDAVAEVHDAARSLVWSEPAAPVVANRGTIAAPACDVGALLAGQLVRPVHWARVMATIAAHPITITHHVTLGPSKLMRGLVRANLGGDARVVVVETWDDVRRAAQELR